MLYDTRPERQDTKKNEFLYPIVVVPIVVPYDHRSWFCSPKITKLRKIYERHKTRQKAIQTQDMVQDKTKGHRKKTIRKIKNEKRKMTRGQELKIRKTSKKLNGVMNRARARGA